MNIRIRTRRPPMTEAELAERARLLDEREAALVAYTDAVNERAALLNERAAMLDERALDLDEREEGIEEHKALLRQEEHLFVMERDIFYREQAEAEYEQWIGAGDDEAPRHYLN